MASRADIIVLGLTAGVSGCLVGGLMLGLGINLVVQGVNLGWLLVLPAGPIAGLMGWFLGLRLAKQAS